MRAGPWGLWKKRWVEEVELVQLNLKRLSLPGDSRLRPPEGAESSCSSSGCFCQLTSTLPLQTAPRFHLGTSILSACTLGIFGFTSPGPQAPPSSRTILEPGHF